MQTINPLEAIAKAKALAPRIQALTGCTAEAASLAASSVIAFPHDTHMFGLGDPPVGKWDLYWSAILAARAWVSAQAQREAA